MLGAIQGNGVHRVRVLQMLLSRGFRGAERHVADLANAQAARHEVLLLLRADAADAAGITIRDWLAPEVRVALLRRPFWWLRAALIERRFRPDILHAHGGRASRLAARLPGTAPRLATMHLDYRPGWYRGLAALVAPTRWQAAAARAGGFSGDVEEIALWHEAAPAPPPAAIAAVRAELGAGPDSVVIGAVGTLIRRKGFDLLIEAFRAAAPAHAVLAIAGEGEERAALRALAGDDPRIRLLGFRRDIATLYGAFDLFVSPAREEPFGLVFLEAMAAGCPILATATEGAREVVQHGLLPVEDRAALQAALAGTVREPRRSYDLSAWSKSRALDRLDLLYAGLLAIQGRR